MAEEYEGRAVVLHAVDQPEDMERALRTAAMLHEEFSGIRVRIIVNGEALTAVRGMSTAAVPEGVEVGVCRIGLGRHGIDEREVPAGIEVVPAAPLAIVQEELAGAAYIRL